jgi:hypothetical protein
MVLDVTNAVAEDYIELNCEYLPVPLCRNAYKTNLKKVWQLEH